MNQVPWGRRGNQLFFDKDGQGPARNSIEYDDFVLFFTRYRESKPVERMTDAYLLDGLKYFRAYQSQKTKALEAKIVKEQNELPVKAYESQIVDAIKNNRVVLIAADTGVLID